MNKIFFDNENDFINTLLSNENNVGIVYCDSYKMANDIKNEILLQTMLLNELNCNNINLCYKKFNDKITLINNSKIIFLLKNDNNIIYKIRGLIIHRVLFKAYPNDDFFKCILKYIRPIND